MTAKVLLLIPEIPGHFHEVALRLGRVLRSRGVQIVSAAPGPYYLDFKGVDLRELGPVELLSDAPACRAPPPDFDYWATYPSFVRRRYFLGAHPWCWEDFYRADAFFRDLFGRHGPFAAVWSENVSNAFLALAYREARRRSVPFLGYIAGRLPGVFNVFLDDVGLTLLENTTVPMATPPSGAPEYMGNPQNDLLRMSLLRSSGHLGRMLVRGMRARTEHSLDTGNPLSLQVNAYRRLIERKTRYFVTTRLGHPFEPEVDLDDGRLQVLFPLQFRPEASTSVLVKHLADDLEVIRNIAFSLPPNARLVVKEHRSAIGMRPLSFYRELRTFPNVVPLGPDFPLTDRLSQFDAVVTLSSTVGFEALQLGVPVLLLGNAFYARYPGVRWIGSFQELHTALRALEKRSHGPIPRAEILRRYLTGCFSGTFNYLDSRCLEEANIGQLAAPVLQVVGGEKATPM